MKPALALVLLISAACALVAQGPLETTDPALDGVLERVRQAAQASNDDVVRLRIDRWKTDFDQKTEMQKIADSVRRNVTVAVPDLIRNVQSSHGSVSTTFKLYHNLNVLYEYVNVLTESAASFGKEEEYTPLSRDAAELDTVRQKLSSYIEQAANTLEVKAARPVATPTPVVEPPKKIVVDEAPAKSATTKKKKTSAPRPQPSSTPN